MRRTRSRLRCSGSTACGGDAKKEGRTVEKGWKSGYRRANSNLRVSLNPLAGVLETTSHL
jgi:hypothetical protein